MITDPFLLKISTIFFACAVLHTFFTKQFNALAKRFPEGSAGENFFHFLGEVEVVFGLWAAVFIVAISGLEGTQAAVNYLNHVNFYLFLIVK